MTARRHTDNQTAKTMAATHHGLCPRCGSRTPWGGDFGTWICATCGNVYPTSQFQCQHPGCFEWALGSYCEKHLGNEPVQRDT
jgi:ribosomal protein L37AE/L43A